MGRKALLTRKMMTVLVKIAPANLVPAAAVIRGELALYGQTGRKGSFSEKMKENGKKLRGNFNSSF